MTKFVKYPSIENSYKERFVGQVLNISVNSPDTIFSPYMSIKKDFEKIDLEAP